MASGRKDGLYSIGEVSKLCNVSKKALRFYDEIGLISPDEVTSNHYRYYSRKSLLKITILKYYKQMGFKLEEVRDLITSEEYRPMERGFLVKIDELLEEQLAVDVKLTSVRDWYHLLVEAQNIIENDVRDVSVKYLDTTEFGFMDQAYNDDYMEAIINLEWTNYLTEINNEITGPVIIWYPSYKGRMKGECESMRVLQKMILPAKPEHSIEIGGKTVLSCYHIGAHEKLPETYEKMIKWAKAHNYRLGQSSIERYVTDYWTTENPDMFVTEVMIEACR